MLVVHLTTDYSNDMPETCPIRSAESTITVSLFDRERAKVISDSSIPARCMGCLALAVSGAITSHQTELEIPFDEVAVIQGTDRFSSTSFIKPHPWSTRGEVYLESGIDADGFNQWVTDTTIVDFDCPVES
jgi:hypothetical protein